MLLFWIFLWIYISSKVNVNVNIIVELEEKIWTDISLINTDNLNDVR